MEVCEDQKITSDADEHRDQEPIPSNQPEGNPSSNNDQNDENNNSNSHSNNNGTDNNNNGTDNNNNNENNTTCTEDISLQPSSLTLIELPSEYKLPSTPPSRSYATRKKSALDTPDRRTANTSESRTTIKSEKIRRQKRKNPFIAFFLSMYSRRPHKRAADVARQAGRQWCRMTDKQRRRYAAPPDGCGSLAKKPASRGEC